MSTPCHTRPAPAPGREQWRNPRPAAAAAATALIAVLIALTGVGGAAAQPATPTAPATPTPGPSAPTTTPPTRWVQPPTPAPTVAPDPASPTPPVDSPRPGPSAAECGVSNISGCVEKAIDGFFARVVDSALDPLLELVSTTLLTTPEPGQIPQIGVLWNQSWQLVTALYVLVVMAAGVLVMMRETLQTQWSIRELAPRLAVGFLAGAMSLVIATTAIGFANALAEAVAGDGVGSGSVVAGLTELATTGPQTQSFGLLLMLALVVMLVVLLIAYVVRVAITILLVVSAPLALMCHGLPGIEGVARWWWRSFAACLAIQVVQSLTLVTALRVFLTPGGWNVLGPNASGIVNLIVALALIGVLIKTPFWLLSVMRIGQGRSFVGSIARGYIAYKTFGLIKGGSAGHAQRGAAATPARVARRGRRAAPAPPVDAYARVRATRDGQLMLPLEGVRRVRPQPSPAPASTGPAPALPARSSRARQLAFDFTEPDPYRGLRPGPGGQYPLPIPVRRVRPAPAPPASAPQRTPARRRPEQLAFDFAEPPPVDPYARLRPTRSGQYPLPFPVARVKPAPVPPIPAQPPAPVRPAGRQLHLPLPDLPVRRRGPRAPRGGHLR